MLLGSSIMIVIMFIVHATTVATIVNYNRNNMVEATVKGVLNKFWVLCLLVENHLTDSQLAETAMTPSFGHQSIGIQVSFHAVDQMSVCEMVFDQKMFNQIFNNWMID